MAYDEEYEMWNGKVKLKTFYQLIKKLNEEGWNTKLEGNDISIEKVIDDNIRAVINGSDEDYHYEMYIEDNGVYHYYSGTEEISESSLEEINDIVRRYEAHFRGEGNITIADGENIEIICSTGNHYDDYLPYPVGNVLRILFRRIEKMGKLEELKNLYIKNSGRFKKETALPFVKEHTEHGRKDVAEALVEKIAGLCSSGEVV